MEPDNIESESAVEALSEASITDLSRFIQEWMDGMKGGTGLAKSVGQARGDGGNAGHADEAQGKISETPRSSSGLAEALRYAEKQSADPPRSRDGRTVLKDEDPTPSGAASKLKDAGADAMEKAIIPLIKEPLIAPRPQDI